MNDPVTQDSRRPIVVADSQLRAGTASARVRGDDPEAVLRQYLRLIRRVRNQQRDRSIALRRVDLAALAEHLGWSDDQVLSRLADLMGSSRRQRTTMAAALAAGAGLITVAGSSAAAPPESGATTPTEYRDPIVVVADHLAPATSVAKREHAARLLLPDGRIGPGDARTSTPAVARGNDIVQGPADDGPAHPGAAPSPYAAADDRPPETTVVDPADDPTPETTVVDPADDRTPETTAEAAQTEAPTHADPTDEHSGDDPEPAEPEVATGGAATDQDGNLVAVGEPPVPPATDQDGNLVAVGEPPVPPTPDADAGDAPEPPPDEP